MKRDSVVIYRNLYEALQNLSDKQYKRIMNAVLKYSMDGEESELTNIENAVFQMAKTQIDSNNRKYENGKKGAEFGYLGGRPKKEENHEETPSKPQANPKETPKCKMLNVNIEESKKESKKIKFKNNNTQARESYEEIMDSFACSSSVKSALFSFIQHLQANKQIMTNERLEDLILELDVRQGLSDTEQIQALHNAINGGYFDIKRLTS